MNDLPHISVCVCTYKRAVLLKRLLTEIAQQRVEGLFTYSVVVADNDRLRSAESAVSEFAARPGFAITYCVAIQQGIAHARNTAVKHATGEYIAFIDDDEFPVDVWLRELLKVCQKYDVSGVLGPVKRHFDERPPEWISRGNFFERPTYPTGTVLDWTKTRTGNVLFRRSILDPGAEPFNPEFRSGEDVDFFRRMMENGHKFVWCNEGIAYEVVPPARWKRSYLLRRALLRGVSAAKRQEGLWNSIKSLIAIPIYTAVLPIALLLGQHWFMNFLVRLCDHLGRLLTLLHLDIVKGRYVSE